MRTNVASVVLIAGISLLAISCNKDDIIEVPENELGGGYREPSESSNKFSVRVFEYTPAPGQFINEQSSGGGLADILTMEEACLWAQERLDNRQFVSLGGFGGYIVVGFDHSIISSEEGYDFAIAGNAFCNPSTTTGGSNEPGIVYVMQDSNGNGLPDDEWYELRGSEYGSETTINGYEVTYYRPASPGMDVDWTDNRGASGTIDYLAAFHKQDYYYPLWVASDSYTLKGICLAPRNSVNAETGLWENSPYPRGYADNMGEDATSIGNFQQCNRFRIADAVKSNGMSANLDYMDFVKVQTAVNAKSGWLGEVSTEVVGFFDLNL